jgi:hypothetical protein
MGRIARALLVAVLAAAISPSGRAEVDVVERVVAVIRSPAAPRAHVLTLTRVEEETRIAVVVRGGTLAATAPLDAKTPGAGLEWLIDQMLLADDAARLQVLVIDPADVATELQRFKARFAAPGEYQAFLARMDASEDDLGAILARSLQVKRYLESRVGRMGVLADAEIAAYAASHAAELPRDAQAARAAARARMEEERAAGEARTPVADLRARAEIRLLHDFGSAR